MKLFTIIKKHPKISITLFLVVLLFIVPFPRGSSDVPETPIDVSLADAVSDVSSDTEVPKEVVVNSYFESDDLVNNFFEKYNSVSVAPIDTSDIKKGNIDTKALVYSDLFSMEVVNSKRGFLSVSISSDPENEDVELKNVFVGCIKAMDETLGDEEVSAAWDSIHETGRMVDCYDFNGVTIAYIPYVELSNGHSNLRIDLSFPVG